MPKTRVYELARDLSVDNKEIIGYLAGLGADVKNHMSVVDERYAEMVRRRFSPTASLPGSSAQAVKPRPVGVPGRARRGRGARRAQERAEQPEEAVASAQRASESPEAPSEASTKTVQDTKKGTEEATPQTQQMRETPKPPTTEPSQSRPQAQQTPRQESSKIAHPKQETDVVDEVEKKEGSRPSKASSSRSSRAGSRPAAIAGRRPAAQVRRPEVIATDDDDLDEDFERKTETTPRRRSTRARRPKDSDGRTVATAESKGRPRQKTRSDRSAGAKDASQPSQPTGPKIVVIPETITVANLANELGLPATTVIKALMEEGIMAAINNVIDYDVAAMVTKKLGAIPQKHLEEKTPVVTVSVDEDDENLQPRPPVVTILGHVDHGKTTLLDAIRESNVAESEAGGITQHTGAYQVQKNGQLITFLDTPGHEAFTAMRARGAQITDVAILVVAADDGVMPQTVEAINHAKAANVPIIVAINKIDRPGASPDRVKQQLADHGLLAEDWGGDTVTVEISALKKIGIEDLLEMVLLVAELAELKANPHRPALGFVIEAELDRNRGPVATVLVQNGTLRVGDMIVAGTTSGRVRAMFDHRGRNLKEAEPSVPVSVLGLDDVPAAGDRVEVVPDERTARQLIEERLEEQKDSHRPGRTRLAELFNKIEDGEVKDLNIIVKADVQGTVEALTGSLEKLSDDRVRVNVIHAATGGITETDVALASASDAIIIGFNVRPEPDTRRAAEREGVDIRLYRVIYEAIDDIKAAMSGLLEPVYEETVLGRAEVRATFKVPNIGTVAGCYVTDGKIVRNALVRVLRDHVVIYEGKISSLKRFKDDVREVAEGYECGIGIERFNDIKVGDYLEAYEMQEVES
ncbi:MAG: translation initiation factor IF-2 [Firmicutes bacterium]|nr:translation initiation factor IF-2 [Bacillota bacterium]